MAAAGIVVIFDFDKTIIDCDSDNWVVDELGATELFNQLLPTMPWNSLMARLWFLVFHVACSWFTCIYLFFVLFKQITRLVNTIVKILTGSNDERTSFPRYKN